MIDMMPSYCYYIIQKTNTYVKLSNAGVKFIVVSAVALTGSEAVLRRIYELYADYALKNPFYSLEMPIRCELFDTSLHTLLELVDKNGTNNL